MSDISIKAGLPHVDLWKVPAEDVMLPKLDDVLRIYQAAVAANDDELRAQASSAMQAFLMVEVKVSEI